MSSNARSDDHRVRVARERRERMRSRLLAAVMRLYAERPLDGPPLVDTVIAHADFSKATFYKYFKSVDEAIGELGSELADEMVESFVDIFSEADPPFFRMVVATHLFLLRSTTDKVWAAFVSRTDILASDNRVMRGITDHLAASRKAGLMTFSDLNAAKTLAIGTLLEAMRQIVRAGSRHQIDYIEEVIAMILKGVGVDGDIAARTIDKSAAFIRKMAADRLPWWRDPWK